LEQEFLKWKKDLIKIMFSLFKHYSLLVGQQ
jgi:hypothetical protein